MKAIIGALLGAVLCLAATAAEMLGKDAKLAIIGDSITEQKLYSVFMETYILGCAGRTDVEVFQFGWGGERAEGYARRMERNQEFFPATVATMCYGMNDGMYRKFENAVQGNPYRINLEKIANFMAKNNVKLLLSSPGTVDTDRFRRIPAAEYNQTLAELGAIGAKVAEAKKIPFADMHHDMIRVMAAAKAKNGANYDVCGGDGVHPNNNGQLVMAYSLLKNLGFDGNLGSLEYDFAANRATGSDGHKIVSANGPKFDVESSRYFFVARPGANSAAEGSILPFLPFNQELNRFTLTVKNLKTPKAEVTFGNARKVFPREALEKGINLAEEFMTDNPFRASFDALRNEIARKQNFETWVGKNYLFLALNDRLTDVKDDATQAAVKQLDTAVRKQLAANQERVRKQLRPVRYPVAIKPLAE